jgi:hypothetical protein
MAGPGLGRHRLSSCVDHPQRQAALATALLDLGNQVHMVDGRGFLKVLVVFAARVYPGIPMPGNLALT